MARKEVPMEAEVKGSQFIFDVKGAAFPRPRISSMHAFLPSTETAESDFLCWPMWVFLGPL